MPTAADARRARWAVLVGLLASVLTAFLTRNTYDSGDSIAHYLFGRYAFQHPGNFFESWAKPVFVLVSAGPSQAGFIGLKLMQCATTAHCISFRPIKPA